ncbi:MAG: restriction endonuclease subunit R [Bacteroidetes bacterium RIFOXYA12_FULL_35_11]|nr:MAG: restriction endonuclease subunit R [Bacteroidetes bacterium GWF2_35_48]OFY74677.1 MAG: restriction endonuclease subunit R [Bacteroidetes bacterium RIFOXYA12_FULL_35_11]OFZ02219.1 MAG: restriction endonuclease subunit R [Bacteroidetes bacterium RIFOXYC12_FULL_35_7]HBX49903.1 restriction endonuclease subunit R [Bacteroidales bacterium]
MIPLNYPQYQFRLEETDGKIKIFDELRKLWLILTPEEWVRQHVVKYLIQEKKYPASLIAIEAGIEVNKLKKRCDIVVFDNTGTPKMIVECKAPEIKITQKVFDQIASYNMKLKVDFLLITNGLKNFCCEIDYEKSAYRFIEEIPEVDFFKT